MRFVVVDCHGFIESSSPTASRVIVSGSTEDVARIVRLSVEAGEAGADDCEQTGATTRMSGEFIWG